MVSHIGSVNSLVSLAPYGGQIEGEDVPEGWPQAPMSFWMRRHDEFDESAPSASLSDPGDHDAARDTLHSSGGCRE